MLSIAKNLLINSFCSSLRIRRKPLTLQMPITSRCNSRCKTCNIWKYRDVNDMNPDNLKKILKDDFFSEVTTVGLNGGEITLLNNVDDILEALMILPKLRHIHIISNGLLADKLLDLLKHTKEKLTSKGIMLGFTLSIDGYGSIHDKTRGIPGCFSRSKRLLDQITANKDIYCNSFNVGCTISRFNVAYLPETECFLEKYCANVIYHLAVPNKRIHTFDASDFYVLRDERSRLLAMEFFQSKYMNTSLKQNPILKFRYFANYYFLKNHGKNRIAQCSYLDRDITIDENLNISLCATASENIGNLNLEPIKVLKRNFSNVRNTNAKYCDGCIHYVDIPSIKGLIIFGYNLINNSFKWNYKYLYLTKWLK